MSESIEFSFNACPAVCPHKGKMIEYDATTKQFFCPAHDSRFDLNGKVVRGPARTNLIPCPSEAATIVSLKAAG